MTARCRLGLALALLLASGASACADDPVLKPGQDPAGMAVAILADGFDYTQPEVAKVLARDGEGEAIAWDAVDGDHRPFAREGGGTGVALAAGALGGVRIVAVRVAVGDGASLAQGIAFATGTPARIVLVPVAADAPTGRDVLLAAAQRFGHSLFIGAVRGLGADEARKQSEGLSNLILLAAGDDGLAAAGVVARVLGCGHGALAETSGADLKRGFLDRLDGGSPPRCDPEGNVSNGEQR
jgi:hypothetical protein